jgi:hypothetical protein
MAEIGLQGSVSWPPIHMTCELVGHAYNGRFEARLAANRFAGAHENSGEETCRRADQASG